MVVFDCTCNTQNSLLLNQYNGDDAPQEIRVILRFSVPQGLKPCMSEAPLLDVSSLAEVPV